MNAFDWGRGDSLKYLWFKASPAEMRRLGSYVSSRCSRSKPRSVRKQPPPPPISPAIIIICIGAILPCAAWNNERRLLFFLLLLLLLVLLLLLLLQLLLDEYVLKRKSPHTVDHPGQVFSVGVPSCLKIASSWLISPLPCGGGRQHNMTFEEKRPEFKQEATRVQLHIHVRMERGKGEKK